MTTHGRFVHLELLTPSLEKSIPFLAQLLDLDIVHVQTEDPFYGLAARGADLPFFGTLQFEPDPNVQSHWIGYVGVNDPGTTASLAADSGGSVLLSPPAPEDFDTEEETVAGSWLISDPQGAVFSLAPVQGAPEGMAGPGVAPGGAAWFELLTTDVDGAAEFYGAVFGWEFGPLEARPDEGPARVILAGGRPYGLIRLLPAGAPMRPHWAHFHHVRDLDAALAQVRNLGGFFFEDTATVPGGRRAIVMEPTGADVGLWQGG
jgi:predicted enzyme related to lactoylglutathione lyase